MAKLRQNHQKQDAAFGGMVVKGGIFALIFGGLFWMFSGNLTSEETNSSTDQMNPIPLPSSTEKEGRSYDQDYQIDSDIFPTVNKGQLVKHQYFGLSYMEEHEQAEWVAYELTKSRLDQKGVDRMSFRPDPKVKTESAHPNSYKNSGYNRGHLVPAADMAFSTKSMKESFFTSNISPMASSFNRGVWKELEEQSRDWAREMDHLYVITGPVITGGQKQIGKDEDITVPEAFFKVLLDIEGENNKGIGFVIPHKVSFDPLDFYAMPIDAVERITGLDFFDGLLENDLEAEVEATFTAKDWSFDKARFNERIKEWNKDRSKQD